MRECIHTLLACLNPLDVVLQLFQLLSRVQGLGFGELLASGQLPRRYQKNYKHVGIYFSVSLLSLPLSFLASLFLLSHILSLYFIDDDGSDDDDDDDNTIP
jgi:hypothetical protein